MWLHDLLQRGDWIQIISWTFWVIFSICLHELAHGWAALWQGDTTPRTLGRMTMNPLVHMGPVSLLVFLMLGIAWGVMPVNPSQFRWGRRGRALVAGAGPAMNLLLVLLTSILLILLIRFGPGEGLLSRNLKTFLETGIFLNLILATFNLLPVPPLDGSGILSGLSQRAHTFLQNPQNQYIGFFIIMAIWFTGMFDLFFSLSSRFVAFVHHLAGG